MTVKTALVQSTEIIPILPISSACMSIVLCSFITFVNMCRYHNNQDIELLHYQEGSSYYHFMATYSLSSFLTPDYHQSVLHLDNLAFAFLYLGKCLFMPFAHFLIGLAFLFLLLCFESALTIMDIRPLSDMWFANAFS